jgi:hypothetical protein
MQKKILVQTGMRASDGDGAGKKSDWTNGVKQDDRGLRWE